MIVFFFQMSKFKCQAKFIDVKMREIEIGSSNVNKVHKLTCTVVPEHTHDIHIIYVQNVIDY